MPTERLNILLIEHDEGFARTIGEMLGQARNLPAEVSSAADLHAGLAALARQPFDLVILDVSVPDGAGIANISLLKAGTNLLPIIAAGAADDEIIATEAVQAGAQDYLVKDHLTPGWLERTIRYALERHRSDLKLLAAEEKYHGIFDHLVEGIFRTKLPSVYSTRCRMPATRARTSTSLEPSVRPTASISTGTSRDAALITVTAGGGGAGGGGAPLPQAASSVYRASATGNAGLVE